MKAKNMRRKRRQAVRIEEREDELPWPQPVESSDINGEDRISFRNPLNNNLFDQQSQFNTLAPPFCTESFPSATRTNNQSTILSDRGTLESVHQKLNLLLRDQSVQSPGAASGSSNYLHFPIEKPSSVYGAVSSNEVCTLFHPMSSTASLQPPPIGVFWDIENCQVPRGKSALVAVQRIRQRFFSRFLEADFVCVCDIRKESAQVIQELNDAQVSVIHVSGNSKNAADDKLRQAMRRFADVYTAMRPSGPTPSVLLISGDINFATDLSDLRYRKRVYIVLLHNKHAPDALILCAHEHYEFHSILDNLPDRAAFLGKDIFQDSKGIPLKGGHCPMDVVVTDLPCTRNIAKLKNRLKRLSDNCGGKVITIQGQFAVIRFPNQETALRASKRMNGEDVFGSKIRVVYSSQMELKNSARQIPVTSQSQVNQKSQQKAGGVANAASTSSWKPTWLRQDQAHRNTAATAATGFNFQQKSSDNILTNSSSCNSESATSCELSRDPSPCTVPIQKVLTPSPLISLKDQITTVPASVKSSNPNIRYETNLFAVPPTISFLGSEHSPQGSHLYGSTDPLTLQSSGFHSQSSQNSFENSKPKSSSIPKSRYFTSSPTTLGTIQYQQSQQSPSQYRSQLSPSCSSSASVGSKGGLQGHRLRDNTDTFDLHVTNIDSNIGDWKIIRQTLMAAFSEHVTVRGIWVYAGQSGSISAIIRVGTKEEAQYAVTKLHQRNIGSKRISVLFGQGAAVDETTLKNEVAALLQDVPTNSLPVFKFREMFEKRYGRVISASDLYRMKDVIAISDICSPECSAFGLSSTTANTGFCISLNQEWESKEQDELGLGIQCETHPSRKENIEKAGRGWVEQRLGVVLPNVVCELKPFSENVHTLLQSQNCGFPLRSFLDCYESEFGFLQLVEDGSGVPLEHMISCVQEVEIVFGENGEKKVQRTARKGLEADLTQARAIQLAQLSRELLQLLKMYPRCSLPFSKLASAYNKHFGRKCRVADFDHISLSALLQALPLTIQILGEGSDKIVTLAHRAQMKRFATDILRVLKARGGVKKQVRVDEFSTAFTQVFVSRQFCPEDYGLCFFADLVSELVDNSSLVALIKDDAGLSYLEIPKREQTAQEIHRTRIFGTEVVDLLSNSIRCEMALSKFIPSYHHHFGRQCRVSDYGFSKLIELFEALGDIVYICNANPDSNSEEKLYIRLTPNEYSKIVGEQVWKIVEERELSDEVTRISDLEDLFLAQYGFGLRPDLCGADDLEDLIQNQLAMYVQVHGDRLVSVDRVQLEQFVQDAKSILELQPAFTMEGEKFLTEFSKKFNKELDMEMIEKNLAHLVIITEEETKKKFISLDPLRVFGREISELLTDSGGFLSLVNLEATYFEKFGRPIRPSQLGYPNLTALLQAIPNIVSLRGKHHRNRVVVLNKGNISSSTPDNADNMNDYSKGGSSSKGCLKNVNFSGGPCSHSKTKIHHAGAPLGNSYCQNSVGPSPPSLFFPPSNCLYRSGEATNVFNFDTLTAVEPGNYGMWMRDGSPPLSPSASWSYHPMDLPSPPVPKSGSSHNFPIPTFPYGPWRSATSQTMMPSACNDYDHA